MMCMKKISAKLDDLEFIDFEVFEKCRWEEKEEEEGEDFYLYLLDLHADEIFNRYDDIIVIYDDEDDEEEKEEEYIEEDDDEEYDPDLYYCDYICDSELDINESSDYDDPFKEDEEDDP